MAMRKRVCDEPGCNVLLEGRRKLCDDHKAEHRQAVVSRYNSAHAEDRAQAARAARAAGKAAEPEDRPMVDYVNGSAPPPGVKPPEGAKPQRMRIETRGGVRQLLPDLTPQQDEVNDGRVRVRSAWHRQEQPGLGQPVHDFVTRQRLLAQQANSGEPEEPVLGSWNDLMKTREPVETFSSVFGGQRPAPEPSGYTTNWLGQSVPRPSKWGRRR